MDTFTPCPISRILKTPVLALLPDQVPMEQDCMSTAYGGFQLGLLPERKINKRAVAAAYGIVTLALLIVINLELLSPERLELRQYHVTELIPMPSLRPEPAPVKVAAVVKPKLLPAVKLPVFEQPKLVMPKEIRRELPQPVEPPKIVVNNFAPPQLKLTAGGARPQLVHTGDFTPTGSSQTPTVNAAPEKCRPEDSEIPTDYPEPEGKAPSYTLPRPAGLTCLQAPDKATVPVARKESREPWPAPISAAVSPHPEKATDAATARGTSRPEASGPRKLRIRLPS